jgi:phosphopantetheine--protein transferase-like protein
VTRVGNDVVDLRDRRCPGKAEDERFIKRVFTEAEAESIRSARDPDARLWLFWAAKEAGYKVISKLTGTPPVFRHDAFRVRLTHVGDPESDARGTVHYRGTEVPFLAERAPDRVHAVAWHVSDRGPPGPLRRKVRPFRRPTERESPDWRRSLRDRFTDREWASIHSPASALVRLAARRAACQVLGVEESALEIVCDDGPPGRMPPRIMVRGEPGEHDLSISHHGRFLAWALAGL